jgi:hypothetical protein
VWGNDLLSPSATNWIPVDWPARTVTCIVNITNITGTYTIAMPNFTPEHECRFLLINRKVGSSNTTVRILAPSGTALATSAASSQSFRSAEFIWTPATGWYCTSDTVSMMDLPVGTSPAGLTFVPTTTKPTATE